MYPGGEPVNPQRWKTHLWILTNANAPVASMKDSGVLAGRGGGESSLSQQSGLKRSEVRWEATLITGTPRRETRDRQSKTIEGKLRCWNFITSVSFSLWYKTALSQKEALILLNLFSQKHYRYEQIFECILSWFTTSCYLLLTLYLLYTAMLFDQSTKHLVFIKCHSSICQ